ncbi:hypothetical protein M0805_001175 [Coniferiporia weirii]|nr:hypothetical protein M0805_001175 [Coniferiporia weirii]
MRTPSLLLALICLSSAFAHAKSVPPTSACKILFDGRVSASTTRADFDKNSSIYDHQFVHGQNQTWAQVIDFPAVEPSLFDLPVRSKALEITLSDKSIFVPGGGIPQTGFRRSELLPALNNGTDATVQGTTTFHWSIRSDLRKPLNLTHEHQLVFHETLDFSIDQIMLKTGAPFNETFVESEHKTLRLEGSQTANPETFFSTPFDDDVWHNFAVTIGWTSNELIVYYSKGYAPLEVVNVTSNDNSGGGQFHTGMIKLPLGDAGIDVVHDGFQETGLNEGLVYSGIFIEENTKECHIRLS